MTDILDTHCYKEHVIEDFWYRLEEIQGAKIKNREHHVYQLAFKAWRLGIDYGYDLAERDQSMPSQC